MNVSTLVTKRPIRVLFVVLTSLMLASSAAASVPAATPEASSIDFAAVVLTPNDLAQAGFPDLGFESGQFASAQDVATFAIWPTGAGPELDAMTGDVERTGFQQAYNARATTNRTSGNLIAIVDVEWGIARYTSPEGAARGFSLLPDTVVTGQRSTEQGTEVIGDDSRIARVDAHDPGSGFATAELVLGFRVGAVTAHVLLRQPVDDPPSVDQIERLARMLVLSIERASEDVSGARGLSGSALYAEPRDDMTFRTAEYLRLNGVDIQSAYESVDDVARRVADYGDATDIFRCQTEIRDPESDYALTYATTLYRFSDDAEASDWLHLQPDRLRDSADGSDVVVGTGIEKGTESASVTLTTTPGADPIHWAIVYARTGDVVAEIALSRVYQAPSLTMAQEFASAQAGCLIQLNCRMLVATPEAGRLV